MIGRFDMRHAWLENVPALRNSANWRVLNPYSTHQQGTHKSKLVKFTTRKYAGGSVKETAIAVHAIRR